MRWRGVGAGVLACAGLLILGAAPATTPGSPPTTAEAPSSGQTDLDGDGLADDLQVLLSDARPNDRFDVIATFHDRASQQAAERELKAGEVRRSFQIVHGFSGTMTPARIEALARRVGLRRIELNGTMQALMDGARRDFGVEVARQRFGVDGSGVGVCVADTGVDPGHEQFDSKLPIPFFDAINGQSTVYDDHGHGTHVASIAVGDGTGGSLAELFGGVAPAADLYVAKILDSAGSGTDEQVIEGIEWCAQQAGVGVINLSIGDAEKLNSDGTDAVSVAVANAVSSYGKVVAAAAGNAGDAKRTINPPGVAELALTVGAVTEWSAAVGTARDSKGIWLAPFSSRGPTVDSRIKPDLVAPGHTIVAAAHGTTQSYTGKSGTSMATPFAAGVAALVLDVRPDLSPARVKLLLENTARDRGAPGKDIDWGAGLIDAYEVTRLLADIRRYDHHVFPKESYIEAVVADSSTWSHDFEVTSDAIGAPLAITMLIDSEVTCSAWLWGLCWGWTNVGPDLDVELYGPDGSLIAYSACPLEAPYAECATGMGISGGPGRQETIAIYPTVVGTYELLAYPYSGEPNNGTGGAFSISIQQEPVAPPPPRTLFDLDPTPDPDPEPASVQLDGEASRDGKSWTATVHVSVTGTEDGYVFGTWGHDGQVGWCVLAGGACSVTRPALANSLSEVSFTSTEVATGFGTADLDGSEQVTIRR